MKEDEILSWARLVSMVSTERQEPERDSPVPVTSGVLAKMADPKSFCINERGPSCPLVLR